MNNKSLNISALTRNKIIPGAGPWYFQKIKSTTKKSELEIHINGLHPEIHLYD
jgi:hypothetical protein